MRTGCLFMALNGGPLKMTKIDIAALEKAYVG
jgi:hypothetical protein